MELVQVKKEMHLQDKDISQSSDHGFMLANTKKIGLKKLRERCIIPVFAKDNESTISHPEFIDALTEVAQHSFSGQKVLSPAVRVSHPIKGRIPEAMGKPADQLLDSEKTIYYERMAFMVEVPTITEEVNGDKLSLSIGGVRAYNLENLYNRKADEKFKVFIGFKNSVCINLCISTDGLKAEIRVKHTYELMEKIHELLASFEAQKQLEQLKRFTSVSLTEHQFAQLVGRARMYQFLPAKVKQDITALQLKDSQVNSVVKEYYTGDSYSRNEDGSINLWKLFNLFTGANKSSYIDTFLDRGANISLFSDRLAESLRNSRKFWYLN